MTGEPAKRGGIEQGATVILEHVVDEVQLFFFSAATNNGHRIHYDFLYATEVERHQGLIVHGPLQAALAARLVMDWIGPKGWLKRFEVQHRANIHAGQRLRFEATVTGIRGDPTASTVNFELRGVGPGQAEFLRGCAEVVVTSTAAP